MATKIKRDQIHADAFAGEFATSDHLHETVYAPADHDHDDDYAQKTHSHEYLPLSGGALTGKVESNVSITYNYASMGTTKGNMHCAPDGTNGQSNSITFGGNNNGTVLNYAVAGVYVTSSSAYGSRMYLGTTDSFGTVKLRITIDYNGRVGVGKTSGINNMLDVAGVINADTAYKVNNGVGTAGQVLRSDGSTGAVFSAIQDADLPSSIARDTELPAVTEGAAEATGGKDGDVHRNSTTGEIFIRINGTWRQIA